MQRLYLEHKADFALEPLGKLGPVEEGLPFKCHDPAKLD